MNGKEKYIASKAYKPPVGSFTQRDDVRDFARSGHGQNYHKMMDLHQQLPTMTKDDPRVQEFKDRRRSFNRYGKYPMGEMLGMSPLDMQDKYMDLSRNVRQTNKTTLDIIRSVVPYIHQCFPMLHEFEDVDTSGQLFTTGGELYYESGREYTGMYHVHDGIPMAGAEHTEEPHDTLVWAKNLQSPNELKGFEDFKKNGKISRS